MLLMNEQKIEKKQHFSVLLNGDNDRESNVNICWLQQGASLSEENKAIYQ